MGKVKKYADGGATFPDDEALTGGAYIGSRLNMPSNTRLGKMSPSDARLYNDSMAKIREDRIVESLTGKKSKKDLMAERAYGMKKGGSVSSASKRADGCATKGKTKGRMV
jgi:hypothetical protein